MAASNMIKNARIQFFHNAKILYWKKGVSMSSSSKRVKSIYSAIASPIRLEVLRILNAKGPLSYSELKTLAGFKSKKESGKFSYHP